MENPNVRPRAPWGWVATAVIAVGLIPLVLTGPCTLLFGVPLLFEQIASFLRGGGWVKDGMALIVLIWGAIALTGGGIVLIGVWIQRKLES